MEIRCPVTKKFHLEVNTEEYLGDLEKLGIEQQTPLIIRIPCSKCKIIEQFEIYRDRTIIKKEINKFHK